MAKTKISEFSATPANNTDIDSINIAEGCAPSGINDAIRELMAQLKDFQTGARGDSFNGPIGTSTAAAGAFTNLTASGTLGVTGVATLGAGAILNTPASVTLTNATGLPIATGVSGLGTGIATALAVNTGSAGAPVLFNGALGTPSSGTVTNLTGTASININGTVGATTATTGAFTTLTTSSTVTLNGGTANGVAYLNGSKVLTTGSGLTFDGTNFATTGTGSVSRLITTSTLADGSTPHVDTSATAFGIIGGSSSMGYKATSQHIWNLSGTSEQMRLTSTGLGIGTSSPSAKLDVAGGAKLTGTVVTTAGSDAFSAGSGTGTSIRVNAIFKGTDASGNARTSYIGTNIYGTDGSMEFSNNVAGLTMSINPSGNVGIGTSSPQARLQVLDQIKVSSANQSAGIVALGDGSSTNVNVGIGRWNGATNAAGTGGMGYFSQGASNAGGHYFYTGDAVAGSQTERMRIDASGNVLIGRTSGGGGKLEVDGNYIRYGNSASYTNDEFLIQRDASGVNLKVRQNTNMVFATNDIERARIDSSGNVLVGTTSQVRTGDRMSVVGSGANVATFQQNTNTSGYNVLASNLQSNGNNTSSYHFWGNTNTVGNWYLYGNGTTSYSSDERLKKNIVTTRDGYIEDICKLRVVKYNWKKDADGTPQELGLIAQEVEQVFPGLVQDDLNPVEEGGEIYKQVKQSVLPFMLLKAIQELKAEFDAYKASHP